MADIFISYAREDETRIRELVRALQGQGWTIFWDRRIPAGKTWQGYIGQALSEAKCVVVAWSHHSITSDWVIEEANDAKDRGVLVPVLLTSVKPPLGFRGIQAADLTNWKPGDFSPYFDQLIQDIAGVVGGKPHRPTPDELVTPRTEPMVSPGAMPTEPPPQELALPKPEPLKARLQEPEAIKPEPPEPGKRRNNLLTGAIIVSAIAIVVGWSLWSSRKPERLPEPRPVEPPVAKAPEALPKAREVLKPEVKTAEPQAVPAKPVSKPAEKPPERQVSQPKPAPEAPIFPPAPPRAAIQRTFTNSIGMSFVLIPAGSFTIGSPIDEAGRQYNESQYPVTISKFFYLQTTEVTQKQWTQVMGSQRSYFTACGDNCPVETVSWTDTQEFIKKLNQMESGGKYRLPTEAEWEYACRAGSKGRFCFGDEEAKLGEYAWYLVNSGEKTHRVGQKNPNAWGLYDMHGNVWEWCQNVYGDYPTRRVMDPTGPKAGENPVIRGGSWASVSWGVRSAIRTPWRPDGREIYNGFRVARDP